MERLTGRNKEYIEREPFIDGLKQHYYNPADYEEDSFDEAWAKGFNAGLNHAIEHAAYAPAANVAPVVRGRWVHGEYRPYCSNCDGYPPTRKRSGHPGDTEFDYTKFCPNCGADMRETEPQKCDTCPQGAHWDSVVICGKDAQRHERNETCGEG